MVRIRFPQRPGRDAEITFGDEPQKAVAHFRERGGRLGHIRGCEEAGFIRVTRGKLVIHFGHRAVFLQQPFPERQLRWLLRAALENFVHQLSVLPKPLQLVVNESAYTPGVAPAVADGLTRGETAMAFPAGAEDIGEAGPIFRLTNPFPRGEAGSQRSK